MDGFDKKSTPRRWETTALGAYLRKVQKITAGQTCRLSTVVLCLLRFQCNIILQLTVPCRILQILRRIYSETAGLRITTVCCIKKLTACETRQGKQDRLGYDADSEDYLIILDQAYSYRPEKKWWYSHTERREEFVFSPYA